MLGQSVHDNIMKVVSTTPTAVSQINLMYASTNCSSVANLFSLTTDSVCTHVKKSSNEMAAYVYFIFWMFFVNFCLSVCCVTWNRPFYKLKKEDGVGVEKSKSAEGREGKMEGEEIVEVLEERRSLREEKAEEQRVEADQVVSEGI